MTGAREVSATREPIGIAEKMQQYFRDFRDFDIRASIFYAFFKSGLKYDDILTTETYQSHNIKLLQTIFYNKFIMDKFMDKNRKKYSFLIKDVYVTFQIIKNLKILIV